MSVVCDTFGCTPDVARRLDWRDVRAILDYRNAQAAIDLFNQGGKGLAELQRHPHLGQLLVDLHRAQDAPASLDAIYADMRGRGEGD